MISRFLKPISKSITKVLCPFNASQADIAADVVVLPTPPLPDVTTTIVAKICPLIQNIKNIIEFQFTENHKDYKIF